MNRDERPGDPGHIPGLRRVSMLAEILRDFLVRCGSETGRDLLAGRLAREGLSASELRELCETVEERGKPAAQTAAIIGKILSTEESWRAFVKDLVFARQRREERQAEREAAAATPQRNAPTAADLERAREEILDYMAARVVDDGQLIEDVAQELSVTTDEIHAAVEARRGRQP